MVLTLMTFTYEYLLAAHTVELETLLRARRPSPSFREGPREQGLAWFKPSTRLVPIRQEISSGDTPWTFLCSNLAIGLAERKGAVLPLCMTSQNLATQRHAP